MRRRRNRIQNMTPAQRQASHERRIARIWLEAVAWGLAEVMKNVYDREDCDSITYLINRHMAEAFTEYEKADAKYTAATTKKRKPAKKVAA